MRTEPAKQVNVLLEKKVGRYLVQVFPFETYSGGGIDYCYRVLLNGNKVRCFSDHDEKVFPKRPAKEGSKMVEQVANNMKREVIK